MLFVHFSADGHSSCFHFSVRVDIAVMIMCVNFLCRRVFSSLGLMLESGTSGSYGDRL